MSLAGRVSAGRKPQSSESPVMNQEREEERRMRPVSRRMMSRREMRVRSSWEMSVVVGVDFEGGGSDGEVCRARRFGLGDAIIVGDWEKEVPREDGRAPP